MHIKRVIPIAFIIISLLYIVFSFTVEERKMIGDVRGWDPGSRAMPIGIGFVMLAASVYLTYKERRSPAQEEERQKPSIIKLVILTILLSTFYILCFRFLGFIISTHILLFTLIYFNYQQDIRWDMIPAFSLGLLISTCGMILFYSIGRYISRYLFLLGRKLDIPMLKGKIFTAGIPFVVLLIIFAILLLLLRKAIKKGKYHIPLVAGFTAIGATEFLFIVFKQIFWVSLVKGLIFW